MSIVKWLAGIVGGLLLLLILAGVAVKLFVDPNDYRKDITQLVKEQTGRDLALDGELSISVFPWLGIRTEQLRFSQPAQIDGDMLSVETAQLRLKLMPLLGKRLEIDTVVLKSPKVNLITLPDGTSSFTGLAGEEEAVPAEATDAAPTGTPQEDETAAAGSAVALVVQGIEITDANVLWDDQQAGSRYEVKDFNLTTGDLLGGDLAPINLSGQVLDASNPEPMNLSLRADASIDAESLVLTMAALQATIDQGGQSLKLNLDDLRLDQSSAMNLNTLSLTTNMELPATVDEETGETIGEPTPVAVQTDIGELSYQFAGDPGQVDLKAMKVAANYAAREFRVDLPSIAANMERQTAQIPSLAVTSKDLNLTLQDLAVSQFIDAPAATGKLALQPFNVAELLSDMQIDYQPSGADALQAVGLSFAFAGSTESVSVKDLLLNLDATTLKGFVSITDLANLAAEFDLEMDTLNLDDYLPVTDAAAEAQAASAEADEAVSGAEALAVPLAALRAINANGSFRAERLVSGGLKLDNIDVTVVTADGVLTVTPKVNLYDGTLAGDIVFSDNEDAPSLHVKNDIDLVNLGNMLIDADVTDQLSGLGTLNIDVKVTEKDGVQSNEGVIKLLAKNGAVKGIDVSKVLDAAYQGYAKLTGAGKAQEQTGEGQATDETKFAELLGTFYLKDNVISNNDFSLKAPLFRIGGEGEIDLATEQINYLIKVAVVGTTSGQGGKAMDELAGLTIPIRLRGNMAEPGYSLDMAALVQGLAKREAKNRSSQLIENKLGVPSGSVESTKDALKGLFRKKKKDTD